MEKCDKNPYPYPLICWVAMGFVMQGVLFLENLPDVVRCEKDKTLFENTILEDIIC